MTIKNLVLNQKGVMSFKHWSRKSYSVFNSLGRLVKIARICFVYSLVSIPLFILGQSDTTSVIKVLDLEEVVVSAQKSPVIYSQSARIVNVLSAEELENLPSANISDILDYIPGIDVRHRGNNGIQADISIRGGSFDQNLILLNGINISDPQTGHHNLNLPIDLNSIDHIEVLQGPGSRIFGPNAFSGAINIITNQDYENYVKGNLRIGDFGLYEGGITAKFSSEKRFINTLSIHKSISNGYAKNTDFDKMSVFYNGVLNIDKSTLDFQLGYSDKSFGANSFYTPAFPDQYEQVKATFASLKLESGTEIKLSPAVYWRRHQDRFELFRYESPSWYNNHNYHLNDILGVKIDANKTFHWGATTAGVEVRSENIWSNVLGNSINDTIAVKNEKNGFYTKNYSRTEINYFFEQSIHYKRIYLSLGLLANWSTEQDFDFTLYPGIDIGFEIIEPLKIYTSINRSLRKPTFTDLFYSGPSNQGNPNLQPEESWNYEGGLKFSGMTIMGNVSYFYRHSDNLIAWVKPKNALPDALWETRNLTQVKTLGFELNTRVNLSKTSLKPFIKSFNIGYTYVDQDMDETQYDSKYSLTYLKHKASLRTLHELPMGFRASFTLNLQDRAGAYMYYDSNQDEYTVSKEYSPFTLFDMRLGWQHDIVYIFCEATNIFNIQYVDIGNVQQVGRWFSVGLNVRIKYN